MNTTTQCCPACMTPTCAIRWTRSPPQTRTRDMRNRFLITLLFSIPVFLYSPMGKMFKLAGIKSPNHQSSGVRATPAATGAPA